MAMPAWAPAAIQGGTGILSPVISGLITKQQNREQRAWNEEMYWMTEKREEQKWREQNEYYEQLWHKMNEYNSPMAQMNRFKEAGLNPNLIYGQSNTAPAIATANFGKGTLHSYNPKIPDLSGLSMAGNSLMAYYQSRESAARTNNLEAQNEVLKQEQAKKALEVVGLGLANSKTSGELEFQRPLLQTSLDAALANLQKTKTETDIALQKNERDAALNSASISEAYQRIQNMRGELYNKGLDAVLKKLDIQLKQDGVQPSDPAWMRILIRLLNGEGNLKGVKENAKQYFNDPKTW